MTPDNNYKDVPNTVWEAIEGLFCQTSCFRSYEEQTLTSFHHKDNESITGQHKRLMFLLMGMHLHSMLYEYQES